MQEERTEDIQRKPSAKPTRQRAADPQSDHPRMLTEDRGPTQSEEGVAQNTPPEALDATPTTREAMVAAIKQHVKDGTYRIDEIALADRLIEMPALWEPRKPRKSRR